MATVTPNLSLNSAKTEDRDNARTPGELRRRRMENGRRKIQRMGSSARRDTGARTETHRDTSTHQYSALLYHTHTHTLAHPPYKSAFRHRRFLRDRMRE